MGKPPYPKAYKFADKPMQVAMAELSMQLAEAVLGEFKSQIAHQKEQARAQQEAAGMGGMLGGMGAGGAPPPGGAPQEQPSGEAGEAPVDEAGAAGAGGAPEQEDEEWATDVASTEESSPVTEDKSPDDPHVKRIHQALGMSKEIVPIVGGIAAELMREARNFHNNIPYMKQEEQ